VLHKDQKYCCSIPLSVTVMTTWEAPFTGGHTGSLPAGEIFSIEDDPVPGATAVCCHPLHYERLQEQLVPEPDRTHPKYSGYYLSVPIQLIMDLCQQLEE
jgi:hypothetical protein